MRFKKGMLYKHKNCKDIIIYVLYSGLFNVNYKLKIEYYNISPYPLKPWPIGIKDKVKISIDDANNWTIYRPCPSFMHNI
jgi:hypothetical protein